MTSKSCIHDCSVTENPSIWLLSQQGQQPVPLLLGCFLRLGVRDHDGQENSMIRSSVLLQTTYTIGYWCYPTKLLLRCNIKIINHQREPINPP
jgi:hypothetical protein